jgi:hypothetical protein
VTPLAQRHDIAWIIRPAVVIRPAVLNLNNMVSIFGLLVTKKATWATRNATLIESLAQSINPAWTSPVKNFVGIPPEKLPALRIRILPDDFFPELSIFKPACIKDPVRQVSKLSTGMQNIALEEFPANFGPVFMPTHDCTNPLERTNGHLGAEMEGIKHFPL